MDKKFDTAFIPQQPLLKVEGSSRFQERMNLPLMIGFATVFISVAVYGGLYFYKASVDRRIVALEKELESKEESLNIADIDRYKEIDTRIGLAKQLLQGHVAFSVILDLMEQITAENIGWTSLSYAPDEKGLIKVSLLGEAPNYSAVYVQAETWRNTPLPLRGIEVGMPVLNPETGTVSFTATLTLDSSYPKYSRKISEQAASSDTGSADGEAATQTP